MLTRCGGKEPLSCCGLAPIMSQHTTHRIAKLTRIVSRIAKRISLTGIYGLQVCRPRFGGALFFLQTSKQPAVAIWRQCYAIFELCSAPWATFYSYKGLAHDSLSPGGSRYRGKRLQATVMSLFVRCFQRESPHLRRHNRRATFVGCGHRQVRARYRSRRQETDWRTSP